jgi:hypothetical protein
MVQERMQKNLDGVNACFGVGASQNSWRHKVSLMRDNLELTLANSRRIAELSARVAETAARAATAEANRSAGRAA